MKPIQSIVVGIDIAPGSRAAFDEAVRIARWSKAKVLAVHVIDKVIAAELEEALSEQEADVRTSLVEDARAACAEFAKETKGAGSVRFEVRIDNRVGGILAAAREADADLLVVGAFGESATDGGTVANACLRHAMTRVLLVREDRTGPFRTIVACTDFSPTSFAAIEAAARIAVHERAALHVLHVFDAPWHTLHWRAPAVGTDPLFQQQYRAALERRLESFTRELEGNLAAVKPTLALVDTSGHRSAIVEYAEKVGADLIALGARGKANVRDILLGSTAEKVLHETECSILAVKPEGFTNPLATGEGQPPSEARIEV